jgi:hypothetical protein
MFVIADIKLLSQKSYCDMCIEPFARQRLDKHIPAATNTQATIGCLLQCNGAVNTTVEEAVFSMGPPVAYVSWYRKE